MAFNYVHGITFGKLGVLIDWGTREQFFPCEFFEYYISKKIFRVGCSIKYPYAIECSECKTLNSISKIMKVSFSRVTEETIWTFRNLKDAKNFMIWLLGGSDSDIHPLNQEPKKKEGVEHEDKR